MGTRTEHYTKETETNNLNGTTNTRNRKKNKEFSILLAVYLEVKYGELQLRVRQHLAEGSPGV